ncbi:MAG: TrmH family RNA methyltransferase [Raoultibacter sp.]|jgi:tRNA G18 (ribose-2'-O)-methylase SpoU
MTILRLDTLSDSRLDAYARLTEMQLRNRLEPEKGIFIAESFKVIARALDAGHVPQSVLMEEKWLNSSAEFLSRLSPEVPVFVLPRAEIEQLSGFTLTRGILAAFPRLPLPEAEKLLVDAKRVAVLDGLVDHTNVGALFRSAAALGIDAVLVTPTCCDPLYRRSVRVSMGTVFQVPWTRIGSDAAEWEEKGPQKLRELGFTPLAFALTDDALALDDSRLGQIERMALIFGTEGEGLKPRIIQACDAAVKIPMENGVDSLNVAAASAVAFWQLCRIMKPC